MTDVIIVGAGLSGLSAAKLLVEKNQSVLVLEARERVGGRTLTIQNEHFGAMDMGASYVGPSQNRVLRLIRQAGAKLQKTYDNGHHIIYNKEEVKYFSQEHYQTCGGYFAWLDFNHVMRLWSTMCDQIPLNSPWNAKQAKEWDRMTVQEFIDQNVWTKEAKADLRAYVNVNVTSEPWEISLLWFLWYVAAAGGPLRIYATTNGGQERKVIGGTQQLSDFLVDTVGKDKILLKHAAVSIRQTADGVSVKDISGTIHKAQYCIVALAPPLASHIVFNPPLSARRIQLMQRLPMGSVIKTYMFYHTPFWRERGLSGTSIIIDKEGPVGHTIDHVSHDGKVNALMGFILADKARQFGMDKDSRKMLISRLYAKVFKEEKATRPVHYEEKDWLEDEWSGGCYSSVMAPGVLTNFARDLRKPAGRVFFAGTETATMWIGYMEGAVQAGERAAKEILQAKGLITEETFHHDIVPQDVEVVPAPINFTPQQLNAPTVTGVIKRVVGLSVVAAVVGVVAGVIFCLTNEQTE